MSAKYDKKDFKTSNECSICLLPFEEDEQVTPLPCPSRHCFHQSCITEWLKTNASCPLCRTEITAEGFKQLEDHLS